MKLLHLSDLHLGTENDTITNSLLHAVEMLDPDLLIITGDFTQIGSTKEYKSARKLLDAMDRDYLAIPGNHDISRFNLIKRFFYPLRNYKQFICSDLNPLRETEDAIFLGLNSARRILPHWNWANGVVSNWQRERIEQTFSSDQEKWQVLFLHHPIHKIDEMPLDVTVFGRKRTMQSIDESGVNLVLTGHVHHSSFTLMGKESNTVFVSASTALSQRVRDQENGFNEIILQGSKLTATQYIFENNGFKESEQFQYERK